MTVTAEKFADTTDFGVCSGIIDDALRSLRISGSILLRESYAPPWGIAVPAAERLATLLTVNSGVRVVAFHLVEFGRCGIQPEGGNEVLLQAGEMIICFGGNAHRLSHGKSTHAQSLETLLAGAQNLRRPTAMGRSAGVSLLCGVFLMHHTEFNPLFAALPPLMHTTLSRAGELHNLSGVTRLMAEEIDRHALGSGYVIERLLEVLCAEAVRAHIETVPHREISWFRGIKDPVVGRAIAAIHSRPGDNWSVQQLARDVAMSPSRFAARFSAVLGKSPMAYIAKWRVNVACRQLATTEQAIEQIAGNVGYDSAAAFTRAFTRTVGVSPAAWRARERLGTSR